MGKVVPPKPAPAAPAVDTRSAAQIRLDDFGLAQRRFMVVRIEQKIPYKKKDSDPPVMLPQVMIRLVREDHAAETFYACLRESWVDSVVCPGDIVNILGEFDSLNRITIDDDHNVVVVQPDTLVSASKVSAAFRCQRKTVLSETVGALRGDGKAAVKGELIHSLFQVALQKSRFTDDFLLDESRSIVRSLVARLYCSDIDEAWAMGILTGTFKVIQDWARKFVECSVPKANLVTLDPGAGPVAVRVLRVKDVEENIWSPLYGLKGKVDVSVEVQVAGEKAPRTLPLEIKTGRKYDDHHMQVVMYTTMMSEKYKEPIACGVLAYLGEGSSETVGVHASREALRVLIQARNMLAVNLNRTDRSLPAPTEETTACRLCDYSQICATYHKAVEGGDARSLPGLASKFHDITAPLTASHLEYFAKWMRFLNLEDCADGNSKAHIWATPSRELEAAGRAFSNMVIDSVRVEEFERNAKYVYTFKKAAAPSAGSGGPVQAGTQARSPQGGASRGPSPQFPLRIDSPISSASDQLREEGVAREPPATVEPDMAISPGDVVALSTESGHYGVSVGVVQRLDLDERTVVISVFQEIKDPSVTTRSACGRTLWRLDKDSYMSNNKLARSNIALLMTPEAAGGDGRRREALIDLVPPLFKRLDQGEWEQDYAPLLRAALNAEQMFAVRRVVEAQDYALIMGMPGTGKTTTLARMIAALASRGKSVLLTSYTHTAVDNVLLKLRDLGVPFLRLGPILQIHPGVQDRALDAQRPETVHDYRALMECPVVATTCLGVSHPGLAARCAAGRRFDYCIVDEASQINQAVCLGPLRFCERFVLVGDHYQLPPLVRHPEAKEAGMDVSLFRRLSDAHPETVVRLESQYRMCRDIMHLANSLIYDHRLKCGSSAVAARRLQLPLGLQLPPGLQPPLGLQLPLGLPAAAAGQAAGSRGPSGCPAWAAEALDPARSVVFLDTDAVPCGESTPEGGAGTRNVGEGALVAVLVGQLVAAGVPMGEIGCISPYQAQLRVLEAALRAFPGVEILTVDKFQGRDKDCIVLSLVRSNAAAAIGELLRDWRRINVAVTRAKSKLIVVGSLSTLGHTPLFASFFATMRERDWILQVPRGAISADERDRFQPIKLESKLFPLHLQAQ